MSQLIDVNEYTTVRAKDGVNQYQANAEATTLTFTEAEIKIARHMAGNDETEMRKNLTKLALFKARGGTRALNGY